MRILIAAVLLVVGLGLAVVSYFFLTTPIGPPLGPEYSEPRVIGGPALFVLGIILIFISAVVYELVPSRKRETGLKEEPVRESVTEQPASRLLPKY